MAARDVLLRPLDAAGERISNLSSPAAERDATFTDNVSLPARVAAVAKPGASFLASPADHVHADPAPMRIVASGTVTIAPGARITLVTVKRRPGELFPPGAFAFVKDDEDGVTWENEVAGADHIALYHERTGTTDELRVRMTNAGGKSRTVEWATVALALG